MKLSISVPEQLWARAKAASGGANASHLVQEALRRYVEDGVAKPAYSLAPPEDVVDAWGALRGQFASEARQRFEQGYRAAVTAFAELSWSRLEFLAEDCRFDVKGWAESFRRLAEDIELRMSTPGHVSQYPPEVADVTVAEVNALFTALGAWARPHGGGSDWEWEPSPTYVRGFTQAARDLWRDINEGTPTTTEISLKEVVRHEPQKSRQP
jgi:hypothetical protein